MSLIEKARQLRAKMDIACGYLTDEQAETVTEMYPRWQTDTDYTVGDRRQDYGLLYRCIQAHHSQDNWRPAETPALWVRTSTEEWPEWIQPQGAHDAYSKGSKVSHLDKHWISDYDSNIWEPSVFGWSEVT